MLTITTTRTTLRIKLMMEMLAPKKRAEAKRATKKVATKEPKQKAKKPK